MVEDAPQVLERARRALKAPPRPGVKPATSAVLVPLVDHPDGPCLLFTVRSRGLRSHAGEVSFPGGRIEPGDATPAAAALREAEEEVGIAARHVRLLGPLEEFLTFRNEVVSAHVGWVPSETLPEAPPVTQEVEQSLLVPLSQLHDPPGKAMPHGQHGADASRPGTLHVCHVVGYELREFVGYEGPERVIHYWRLANGATVWGITGHLLATLLERLYGWRPSVRARRIRGQDEVLP